MPAPFTLEDRFTRPDGWREGDFVNLATDHKIHYAGAMPPGGDARAIVVILPGLSEFGEKYYETARDMLARHLGVWVIDWAYQGRSSRAPDHPMRRHSDGFDSDIQDLHKLISDHVLPAANGRPLVMLAHSMGGHLGLRYLAAHAGIFSAAAVTAPMLGMADLEKIPPLIRAFLLLILRPFARAYVPGGKDWHEAMRTGDGTDIFSADPVRDGLHGYWSRTDPALRVGNATVRWLREAITSCKMLMNTLDAIRIPVLVARAGHEKIVDNDRIAQAAALLPNSTLLDLPDAHHEILMERDDSRNRFLEAFDKLLISADIR